MNFRALNFSILKISPIFTKNYTYEIKDSKQIKT